MKRNISLLLTLSLVAAITPISNAQTPASPTDATATARAATDDLARATQQARAEIQAANDDFNAALLRGDAEGALKWLAPDFEMGRYQYRVRDLNWAKRALPLQLEQARFTELSTSVDSVEWDRGNAVTRGHLEARTVLKNDDNQPPLASGMSSGGTAGWTQTPQGWRLLDDNGIFYALSQLVPFTAPIALPEAQNEKPHPSGLTRENPAVVLEQSSNLIRRVNSVAFSPDGATLATSTGNAILFASTQTGAPTGEIKTPAHIWGLAYAPDGSVFSAGNDGKVRQWNAATSALMQTFALGDKYNVDGLVITPDGKTLAASNTNAFQLWDVPTARKLRTFPTDVAVTGFSPDGKLVALQIAQAVEVRRVNDDALVARYENESWGGFGADRKTVITQNYSKLLFRKLGEPSIEGEIEIPDPFRKKREQDALTTPNNLALMNGLVYSSVITISPDGTLGVSRFVDGTLGVFDVKTGQLNRLLRGFNGAVMGGEISSMAFSRDSKRLAIGSRNGETAIWNLSSPNS